MNKKEVNEKEELRHSTSGQPDKQREKHGTDLAHGVGHKYGSGTLEPDSDRDKQKGSK